MKRLAVISSTAFLALFLASLSIGPAGLKSPLDYLDGVEGVERYRLLRTLAAVVVGASLASSGSSLQQVLRNPLVDPYLLGIATGSSFAVALGLVLGLAGPLEVGILAVIGGFMAYSVVVSVASMAGLTGSALIIVGVAFSYLFGSLTTLLVIAYPEKLQGALYWLFGSAAYVDIEILAMACAGLAISLAAVSYRSKALESLSLGEESARSLGVDIERLRLDTVTSSLISVALAVALAGPIGFVGLTAPWLSRLMGATRFQQVLAASAPLGAGMVLAADIIARTAAQPAELPLTPIASLLGVPILVYVTLDRWRRLEAL